MYDLRERSAFSPFEFDKRKAVETLLYVARRAPIPDRIHICKIIYFADKYHLENFGRFIFGDHYVAMHNGPVPSGAYDLIKAAEAGQVKELRADDLYVMGLRDPLLEVFSESDFEALDQAVAQYGNISFSRLSLMSHDEAWKTATEDGKLVVDGGTVPMEFNDIAKMIAPGDSLLKYISDYY